MSTSERAEATLAALSFCSSDNDNGNDNQKNETINNMNDTNKNKNHTDVNVTSMVTNTDKEIRKEAPTRSETDISNSSPTRKTGLDGSICHNDDDESPVHGILQNDNENNSDETDTLFFIPDWVEEEAGDSSSFCCNSSVNEESVSSRTASTPALPSTARQLSMLEDLSPDISAMILYHLSVQEIAKVALVSRTMSHHSTTDELWKRKFVSRWNFGVASIQKNTKWLQSYQEAYMNPHDLWVTHWNCVYPDDGDVPGRCCIPDAIISGPQEEKGKRKGNTTPSSSSTTTTTTTTTTEVPPSGNDNSTNNDDLCHSRWMDQCPTCRYQSQSHDLPEVVHQAMARDRRYRQKKKQKKEAPSLNGANDSIHWDDDPIDEAQVIATAHSLLLHHKDNDGRRSTAVQQQTPSRAKSIFAITQYSIAKFCRQVQTIHQLQYEPREVSISQRIERACQAFVSASTFHRQIRPEQYKSSGLFFLDDTLFFNVGESRLRGTKEGQKELNHLRQDVYGCDMDNNDDDDDDDDNDDNHNDDDENDDTTPSNRNNGDQNDPVANTTTTRSPSSASSASVSRVGCQIEVSHHTWHIVRFTNPDYVRPITFRIFVQRPDCFTVYPSEGYLEAGESCQIVLGVRPPGSLLSEAFETLDVHREEVDPFLADVYSKEAHLPFAPYAIRYMFAPTIPCIPPLYTSRGGIRPSQTFVRPTWTQAASSKYKNVVEYLWDNVATETNVRTKYLSAHVNSNYSFDEFQLVTLFPFDIDVYQSDDWGQKEGKTHVAGGAAAPLEPSVFVAPNLLRSDPETFEGLQNIRLERELSDAGVAYRTEKNCTLCGRDWGYRSEELGRAYILRKLVCDFHERKRHQQMKNLITCLRHVSPFILQSQDDIPTKVESLHQILYALHTLLVQRRAARAVPATRLLSTAQQTILVQLELLVDQLCVKTHARVSIKMLSRVLDQGENKQRQDGGFPFVDHLSSPPRIVYGHEWRDAGVYRHVRCTDSVFGKVLHDEDVVRSVSSKTKVLHPSVSWKSEPEYLDGFRHLWHNPGFYCIGKQEDPNHDNDEEIYNEESSFALSKRFHRPRWERNTDVYMDNAVLGFASALSMIADPRSLLVHGVYDRSPDSIVRRPMLPEPIFLHSSLKRYTDQMVGRAVIVAAKWKASIKHSIEKQGILDIRQSNKRNSPIYLTTVDLDCESHNFLHWTNKKSNDISGLEKLSSLARFVNNIPPPGVGKFLLTSQKFNSRVDTASELVPVSVVLNNGVSEIIEVPTSVDERNVTDGMNVIGTNQQNRAMEGNDRIGNRNVRGPRILRFLWLLSAMMGWSVDESQGPGSIFVDRRILIASQWVSNSLAAWPLISTLVARSLFSITPMPIEYHLEGLPFEVHNEMRYLTGGECAFAALVVTFLWLYLGRYSERSIGRSFERTMMEHFSMSTLNTEYPNGIASRFNIWCQRQWDRVCPLFMQRLVFTPRWNRRSRKALLNHIAFWRNKDFREHRSTFRAEACLGGMTFGSGCQADGTPIEIREESAAKKIVIGVLISLGSFCICSPHFLLNLMTVFCCSIALGLSMSLQSMETGRGISRATETRSILKPFGLNTLVIGFFLVGQLVGCSGGILFLAEFVVTSMCLVLGGAGTISAAAMESWACFFCLSSTAFWGYVFARVAIMDGMQTKRRGATSLILCISVLLVLGLWAGALFLWKWEMPPALMILRASIAKDRRFDRKYLARQLQ